MTEDGHEKLLSLARIFGGIGGGIAILSVSRSRLLGKAFAPVMGGAPQGERMGFIMAAVIYGGRHGGVRWSVSLPEKSPPRRKSTR